MVRFIVSAIPFLPFVLNGHGDRHTRTEGVELGLWVSFGYVSQALGLLTSEAGRASFISAFTVCDVALSSVVWFLIKDIFNDVHQLSFASCSSSKLWDFMTSFPWIPALYTGVFSTGLCLWAEMYAMGDVSATETAIIYGMEPLWVASFAWFLLDERWDTTACIGAALVLCGSLTVQILGSAQVKSNKVEDSRSNTLKSSQKQNYFSFSAVVVDSRKDVARQFKRKRQDKLS